MLCNSINACTEQKSVSFEETLLLLVENKEGENRSAEIREDVKRKVSHMVAKIGAC